MMYYTYVLLCEDRRRNRDEFYTGSSEDIKNRVKEHKSGEVKQRRALMKSH